MFVNSFNLPFCVRFRTERILSSKIRYFDLFILIPNCLFLVFILIKWMQKRTKLNPQRPLLFTISGLILILTMMIIIRCIFVMIVPEGEALLKILALIIRSMHLWTEFCVLLFGRSRTIRIKRTLIFSLILSLIFISIETVLEFRGDTRPIQFQSNSYKLYSYGGMKYLLISSSIFFLMYILNFVLICFSYRSAENLPVRRSFYFYCFVMASINLMQMIGTILNLSNSTIVSMCLIDGMKWILDIGFAPFVYYQFIRRVLSSKILIPQIIYADSTMDGGDDDLIDPSLDGQFDDITASTKIIPPIL